MLYSWGNCMNLIRQKVFVENIKAITSMHAIHVFFFEDEANILLVFMIVFSIAIQLSTSI